MAFLEHKPGLPIITVIGSLNTDFITRTARLPGPGETFTAESFETGSGGKGANQAVACCRLSRSRPRPGQNSERDAAAASAHDPAYHAPSVAVKMIGAVGADSFGRALVGGLEGDGIDCEGVFVARDTATGVANIIVEADTGENRILLAPNANHYLSPADFIRLPTDPLPDLIVLQMEIRPDTVLAILQAAQKASVPVLLNPAPAFPLPDGAYGQITHLIMNESEAALLSGVVLTADHHHRHLGVCAGFLAKGVDYVVVTCGARGAYYASMQGWKGRCPAPRVQAARLVDTTGAGDTFVGAYAVRVATALGRGADFDFYGAVNFACTAAARSVERAGAQAGMPWLDDLAGRHDP